MASAVAANSPRVRQSRRALLALGSATVQVPVDADFVEEASGIIGHGRDEGRRGTSFGDSAGDRQREHRRTEWAEPLRAGGVDLKILWRVFHGVHSL